MTAKDASNNTIPYFSALFDNITLSANSPLTGTITGLGCAAKNVLNKGTDFVNGVADLTALGMTFNGVAGTGTFMATSADNKTGSSGNVTFVPGSFHYFLLRLSTFQTNSVPFIGVNTLTAKDVDGNAVTDFDESLDNVAITRS